MTAERNDAFAQCHSPENWEYMAMVLQKAAYEIDWTRRRDITDWRYASIHRMLMGLSIENLLKAALIAQGIEPLVNGKLNAEIGMHGLTKLAAKIEGLSFDESEIGILKELEAYVTWAGRYPMPRKADDIVTLEHSRILHDAEYALAMKIVGHLRMLYPAVGPDNQLLPQILI